MKKKDIKEDLFKEMKDLDKTFQKAVDIPDQSDQVQRRNVREKILIVRSLVGDVLVMCPHCGHRQKSHSVKSKKCVACNHSFVIFSSSGKIWRNRACIDKRIANPTWKGTLFRLLSLELEGKEYHII